MDELNWLHHVFKNIGLESKTSNIKALDFLFSFRKCVEYIVFSLMILLNKLRYQMILMN